MAFNGNEGAAITLTTGEALTAAFRSGFAGQPQGYFFGKNHLQNIIDQTGCEGIRVYFGASNGKLTLVLVGADANCNDQTAGIILDSGVMCPPNCGAANGLNS